MQFIPRPAQTRLCLSTLALLSLQACVGAPRIAAIPAACTTLLPDSWRQPVPGAPLPADGTVGELARFGDEQTGQLDKANGRTADTIGIIERCEARDRAAVKAVKPRLFGLL